MDAFKYQVALAELNNCKYAKDLKDLVRKWQDAYRDSGSYLELKHTYKLYTLSLNLYTLKSKAKLPNFLYKDHIDAQQEIIWGILHKNKLFDMLKNYNEFVDFFEFDTIVETPIYQNDCTTSLHNIVLDKPLHFKFKFNHSLSSFDRESTEDLNFPMQKHLHALRLKTVLSPNHPSTVLDQYVLDTYKEIIKHQDVSAQILKLQQHILALETYQSYSKGTLNG